MLKTTITEQERQALDAFLSEHWSEFGRVASDFMTADEIENLGRKLGNED